MLPNPRTDKEIEIATNCQKHAEKGTLAEYVADELLGYFSYQQVPTTKPELLIRYEKMNPVEKIEFRAKYPEWNKGEVEDFQRSVEATQRENESNLLWLNRWKEEVDPQRALEIDQTINTYNQYQPLEVARVDWD